MSCDKVLLGRTPLFRSAAERYTSAGYDKLVAQKHRRCKIVRVTRNNLQILQGGLESTVAIHRATLAPKSRWYCDVPKREIECSTEERPCTETDSDDTHQSAKDSYFLDKTVRHIGPGHHLRYIVRW